MINIIVVAILLLVVGSASFYIWKEKRKGKCVGCPYSGCGSCSGGCGGKTSEKH